MARFGRREGAGHGRPAVLLQAVLIHDGGQVAEAVAGGDLDGLPDHPLLALAVAEHHEGTEALAAQSCPERNPDAHRQALPQRSGGCVETGQAGHVRVALKS